MDIVITISKYEKRERGELNLSHIDLLMLNNMFVF